MDSKIINHLKKNRTIINAGKDEQYSVDEAIECADNGDYWLKYILGYELLSIFDGDLTELNNMLLTEALLLGKEVYSKYPDLGCGLLASVYNSWPAIYVKNEKTGDWDEDFDAEKKNTLNAAKYFKEGYEKYGQLECGVSYARLVVVTVYRELDPQNGITVLKEILSNPNCPASAYTLMAQELMIGKRIQKDTNKAIQYFDKAISMGDKYAPSAKEHFVKTFMSDKPKRGWFW